MTLRTLAVCAALLLQAVPAAAQNVKLEFAGGRVTLIAQNASISAILAEWARLGGTRIVNGERIPGAPVTLELRDVPEQSALDLLFRGVAGYMLAARPVGSSGASTFDRIMILPVSSAPRPASSSAAFTPAPVPVPQVRQEPPRGFGGDPADFDLEVDVDDAPQPIDALRRAQEQLRQRLEQAERAVQGAQPQVGQPRPGLSPVGPAPVTVGGRVTAPAVATPYGVQGGQAPNSSQPATSAPPPLGPSRPPSNPFLPTLPGSSRPGEITPVPQQPPQDDRN
jgi:hypothetical protein